MEDKKSFSSWFTPHGGLGPLVDYVTISKNTISISPHLFAKAPKGYIHAKIGYDTDTGSLYIEPTDIDDPNGYKLIPRENKEGKTRVYLNVPKFVNSYHLEFNPHKREAIKYDAYWDKINGYIVVRDVKGGMFQINS